jgi:hypothetical protein
MRPWHEGPEEKAIHSDIGANINEGSKSCAIQDPYKVLSLALFRGRTARQKTRKILGQRNIKRVRNEVITHCNRKIQRTGYQLKESKSSQTK